MSPEEAKALGMQYFSNGNGKGFNCAESTLMAICEAMGIENDLIPKIATPFGGGICRRQETCGAVSGSLMGIGAVMGRMVSGASRERCYKVCNALLAHVEDQYRSTICREIVGFDLKDQSVDKDFRINRFKTVCSSVVGECCSFVVGQLNNLNTKNDQT